ncbi:MAG: hypothetical protein AAFO95_13495 [Cyanobacteria bacterium J06600_6]
MSWHKFLLSVCNNPQYELTLLEREVIMCIEESKTQTKNDLFRAYNKIYLAINEEAFTQRLKNIYRKFKISSKEHKLPQLRNYLTNQYLAFQNQDIFFSEIGLKYVHPQFPRERFGQELTRIIDSQDPGEKQIDILQTFAPNLDDYYSHLVACLQHNIQIRILLAWSYSNAAQLREAVLSKYANNNLDNEVNINNAVIANLETLEKILQATNKYELLKIKLYNTLPSLAIYRAGNYVLAAPFLHGSLAINTFQLELNLNVENGIISNTLQQDFELMWQVARSFCPDPARNWRNDLKILFAD